MIRHFNEEILETHRLEGAAACHSLAWPGAKTLACQHDRYSAVESPPTRKLARKGLTQGGGSLARHAQARVRPLQVIHRRVEQQLALVQEADVGGDALQIRHDMGGKQDGGSRLPGPQGDLAQEVASRDRI